MRLRVIRDPWKLKLPLRLMRYALIATLSACLGAWAFFAAVTACFGEKIGAGFAGPAQTLCVLDRDGSARIIVGGDSRAKDQIDPAVLAERTGLTAVNIGENISVGGDLATFVNSLRGQPAALASRPIILFSVSPRSLNDFAFGNQTSAALWNWNPWDHARAALGKPGSYLRFMRTLYLPGLLREAKHAWRRNGFACEDGVYLPPPMLASKGYRPNRGRSTPSLVLDAGGHRIDGGDWRAFRKSLAWLADSPARAIVIMDAPVEPTWYASPRSAEYRSVEARFSEMMAREARTHGKVVFLDLVSRPPPGLDSSLFYDYTHLNAEGADILSGYLAEYLKAQAFK
jgi:hypothetical protein